MQSIKFDNKIIKRNGQIVSYDITKISYAISKALSSVGDDIANSDNIALSVENILKCKYKDINDPISIEVIQDIVEQQLMGHGYFNAARSFIVYREEHKKARSSRLKPDSSSIEDYIFTSKYARYLPEQKRRETFVETCSRVRDMFIKKYPNIVDDINWAFEKVFDKYCLPSMRAMQFGGTPIEKHNARLYNCSFSLCDRVEFFSEAMYLLMCGVGVGFSVEFEHVEKLPILVDKIKEHDVEHFVIEDTIEGWADSVKALINSYLTGKNIEFCYTLIRPFGSSLKSSGGRAPGHVPLRKALDRCRTILDGSLGRKLKPIECYDIVMHCSDAVLAGGVRRSACICLFSQDDGEMINSKRGNWFNENPQRARSNNSVKLIRSDVTKAQFLRVFQKQKEWGEPGFFFANHINHGTNPCLASWAEIDTTDGIKNVSELIGKQFTTILDGKEYISTEKGFFYTGIKEIYNLITIDGHILPCTSNHLIKVKNGENDTWKEAGSLTKDDYIRLSATDENPKYSKFLSFEYCSTDKVYDCTIPEINAFSANGIYAHNCAEICFDPTINILGTVRTGWQFCNLTEINGSKLVDAETFKDAVKAATIIGTCQAGFTSFPYLGKITEEICKRDALLGVSITGMMENPDIALCPEIQNYMANYAIEINKHYSNLIDINPASRVTCVKPAGTTSLVLGTASGIHPRHARRYFRRVQANINDPVYKYFKQHNPHMCEKSIYSANNTDDVITFCIESSEKAIVKKDICATELLMHVLQTQMNWVKGGNNSDPSMNHNVSNTITVEPNEWDEVAEFIWNNRSNLTGVTTLSATGDKDYPQVPHEEIVTENDEIKWNNIIKNFKHVDYTGLIEDKDNTELKSEAACAGGSCALI
jgi:hypothetical protein